MSAANSTVNLNASLVIPSQLMPFAPARTRGLTRFIEWVLARSFWVCPRAVRLWPSACYRPSS